MEQFLETLSFINHPGLQGFLTPFRWALGALGIGFFLFIVFVLLRSSWAKFSFLFDVSEFFTFRPYGLRRMLGRWQKVQARLQTANEAEYKLAVIEADGMLNEILLRLGFRGETLGDKLKTMSTAVIPNLSEVIAAHQVRNNVVHDPDFRLALEEAQRTLSAYEAVFSNLDLI